MEDNSIYNKELVKRDNSMNDYKIIDLKQWHKTGEGANSASYVNEDESLMLKLFKLNAIEETAKKDILMAQNVASIGIATAKVYEIVKIEDKFGVIYQNLKGKKSYSRMIADNPEKVDEYAKAFAKKAKELHSMPCNTELFDRRTEMIRKGVERSKYIDKYKTEIYKVLDKMDEHKTCLHGDLQTGNLVRIEEQDFWIDFDKFAYGDPVIDIAHMYTMYSKLAWFPYIQNLTHMNKKMLKRFWAAFVQEYYGIASEGLKEFNKSLDIYNALDLVQRSYYKPGLIADLVSLILVKPKLKKYFNQ